jgi:hypothetical protein
MTDSEGDDDVAYHLLLDAPEAAIAVRALHLLISDEAHEPDIRAYARAAIAAIELAGGGAGAEAKAVPLTAPQMKIVHTAVHLLLLDTQRDQEAERQLLWSILEKLPDEHALRAIELD